MAMVTDDIGLLKPNFFIIGAAKAGTSTLYRYLYSHPNVFMPQSDLNKEPAFFSFYTGQRRDDRYFKLFKSANKSQIRIGEASTAYISDQYSPALITAYKKKYNINVKLLVMLRNPVDRAYSLYNWNVSSGIEPASSFEEALRVETHRMQEHCGPKFNRGVFLPQYLYFETGKYAEQLKNFFKWFPREDIHVCIFELFIQNPSHYLADICRFLDINDNYVFASSLHANPSYAVFSPKLQVFLRLCTRLLIRTRLLSNYKSIHDRDFLMRIGRKGVKPSPIRSSTRQMLEKQYEKSIFELEDLLGISLVKLWLSDNRIN